VTLGPGRSRRHDLSRPRPMRGRPNRAARIDGTLVNFDAGHFADTPAEEVEELRAIVESATFEFP